MADFLECLIQIKALRETTPRLRALIDKTPPERWRLRPAADVWAPVEDDWLACCSPSTG